MRSARALAAGWVAFVFGVVSYIMIRVERDMGFVTPADYFDPVKVTVGYASSAWLVSTILYLTLPIALFVLAKSSVQERVSQFGLAAAGVGLLLGTLDLVGIQLASLLPSEVEVQAAVAAMIPIRFAVLKATVLILGLFAWSTTRVGGGQGIGARTWRALGWFVLAVSVTFLFVFVPVPIAFFVWGAALTLIHALQRGDPQIAPVAESPAHT